MTLEGTNTYLIGRDPVHVIDPGPAIDSHVEAIRSAAAERGVIAGILLTHSHADHSAAVPMLEAPLLVGSMSDRDEAAGGLRSSPAPDAGVVGPFTVVPTPGHAADHACFLLGAVCFCGDLVLGFGSSIVPPAGGGGSLVDYMASLEGLRGLDAELLCPGHGPWITSPGSRIDEYAAHRRERERNLVEALEVGKRTRDDLLDAAWGDVPEPLRPAAAMAMQAHLEKLDAEGRLPEGFAPGDAA